jgi:DNA-binding MarR family transcriptional regulator
MDKRLPPESVISLMSKKLRSVYAVIRREMTARGLEGLDISHGDILFALFSGGSRPMNELSRKIDRDKSTVTSLVVKLERLGFVKRTADPADKRSFLIELTDRGKKLETEFNNISEKALDSFWKGVPRNERTKFMEILGQISS